MVLPGTFFHCTGTSVVRSPRRRARGQDLHVEGEPVDSDQVEEEPGGRSVEGLEPALGVLQTEAGAGGHQPIEDSAHGGTNGIGSVDHGMDQSPGADGHLARCEA